MAKLCPSASWLSCLWPEIHDLHQLIETGYVWDWMGSGGIFFMFVFRVFCFPTVYRSKLCAGGFRLTWHPVSGLDMHFDALRCFATSQDDQALGEMVRLRSENYELLLETIVWILEEYLKNKNQRWISPLWVNEFTTLIPSFWAFAHAAETRLSATIRNPIWDDF